MNARKLRSVDVVVRIDVDKSSSHQLEGTDSGDIKGTMAFDRRDYGMTHGIPFIRIADRVEVNVTLQAKRVSGPPIISKQ
jgi:polyisoprenoid-binding protein YceI